MVRRLSLRGADSRRRGMRAGLFPTVLVVLVCAAVVPTVASAGSGNSANAKACQQGGWQSMYTPTGETLTFADQGACVSYAAEGGVLATGRLVWTTDTYYWPYGPLNQSFGVLSGSGLAPGSEIKYYGQYTAFGGWNGYFGSSFADSAGNVGPLQPGLYCGIGWSNVYVTGTAANGTAITSNIVNSPCG